MHPFPPTAALQFLIGEEIGQICLDPNGLQFRFAAGGQISVQCETEYVDRTGSSHSYDCVAWTGGALYLHQLLQRRITKVEAEPLRLSLTFDNGAVLNIFSEKSPYECGQIVPVGRPMIVF
jgi:hypothetical protein